MFSFPSFYLITTTLLLLFTTIPLNKSQPFSPRLLDSILQEHAFQPLSGHRTKTGVIYSGNVPSNLTGTSIAALRLRSGSLRRRGYSKYNEFSIPKGVVVSPYVKRVILVYHNLGNWSSVYYPLKGYVYLSNVVGLLAYNASDVYAKELQELDVRVSGYPFVVKFKDLKDDLPHGSLPKCVFFDLFGGVEFEKLVNGSVCVSVNQGHFGVVVEDGLSRLNSSDRNPSTLVLIAGLYLLMQVSK
ncbi:hypothetical protein CTI12_AA433500 [Artemisia annua]|uniref:Uncharacterized protein n=1 Tax=Artemisia annua TaxID=35608 RepID=A0A2U1M0Z6_ARTAN|nr:hypothetical protein CTI12_AA433500 [Artemisia annua]